MVLCSCSVISREMKTKAGPGLLFGHLMENPGGYLGQTVILGGYIIGTENRNDITLITVLHAPLDMTDSPLSRDSSQGRFIVIHEGFLDPEVYANDRRITVAGVVLPPENRMIGTKKVRYIKIRSRELYLHGEKGPVYYDPGYFSYPYYRHSFYYNWNYPGCCP